MTASTVVFAVKDTTGIPTTQFPEARMTRKMTGESEEATGSNLVCRKAMVDNVLNILGDGFKYFLCSSLFGEDSHFDSYFSNGLQPPTTYSIVFSSEMDVG